MRESFAVRASKQKDMQKIKETPIPINIKKGLKGEIQGNGNAIE